MNEQIFIEYRLAGQLSQASSVQLGSSDGSFGIKDQNGMVIVHSGTAVTNPSTGVYQYTFNALPNTIYTVSWKIISQTGDQPIFTEQTAGPFSVTSDIRSVPDQRGGFVQGTLNNIFLLLTDIHGSPITADTVTLTISSGGVPIPTSPNANTLISNVAPDFIKPGLYAFNWSVPSDLAPGPYLATWNYTSDGFSGAQLQEVIVAASGDVVSSIAKLYGSRISDLRIALSEMIACAQHIPAFYEEAIPDAVRSKYKLTFNKWNQVYGTRIYRNSVLIEEGIEINYPKGYVTFDQPLSDYDTVHADYNFRWYSDNQLDRFMSNALLTVNLFPPQTNFGLLDVPDIYIPIVLYGGARDAIRELMMCDLFQQPAQVFGGPDAAQKAFANMDTLKKNYEEDFMKLLEQKKFGAYPKMRIVVTPEYTLPGGRSRWFRYLFGNVSI